MSTGSCPHGAKCHFSHEARPRIKKAKKSQPKLPQDLLYGVLTVRAAVCGRTPTTYTDLRCATTTLGVAPASGGGEVAAPTDQHQYSLTVKGVGTWRNLLPHASKSQAKSELACLALKALGYRAVQLPLTHDGSSAGYKLAVLSASARLTTPLFSTESKAASSVAAVARIAAKLPPTKCTKAQPKLPKLATRAHPQAKRPIEHIRRMIHTHDTHTCVQW